MIIQTFHYLFIQISRQELKFVLDQHLQILGLDRKATTKIAKTLKRRVLSYAQETFMKVDLHSDSDPDSTIVFFDNSTKSNDSAISDAPNLPLNVLLLGMLLWHKVAFFIDKSTYSMFIL